MDEDLKEPILFQCSDVVYFISCSSSGNVKRGTPHLEGGPPLAHSPSNVEARAAELFCWNSFFQRMIWDELASYKIGIKLPQRKARPKFRQLEVSSKALAMTCQAETPRCEGKCMFSSKFSHSSGSPNRAVRYMFLDPAPGQIDSRLLAGGFGKTLQDWNLKRWRSRTWSSATVYSVLLDGLKLLTVEVCTLTSSRGTRCWKCFWNMPWIRVALQVSRAWHNRLEQFHYITVME